MRPVVLRPEASEDIEQARPWYESKLTGLGERFLCATEVALLKIEDLPEAPALVYHDVRFVSLQKFPYGVFYRVVSDRVDILAVVHSRRTHRTWIDRID